MDRKRKAATVRQADSSVHRALKQAKTEKEDTKKHILNKELWKQKKKNPEAFQPISMKYIDSQSPQRSQDHPGEASKSNPHNSKPVSGKKKPEPQPMRSGALKGVRRKPVSLLERKKQDADEALKQKNESREQEHADGALRRKQLKEKEKTRMEKKKKMYKQNARGQPLMKYRMDNILEKLKGV